MMVSTPSVPAGDFAAYVNFDFGGVAGEGDVEVMLHSGLEVQAAFEEVGDVVGQDFHERLAAGDILRDHYCRIPALGLFSRCDTAL